MSQNKSFFNQSASSYDTFHSMKSTQSFPISDITIEYDYSQLKYEFKSEDGFSDSSLQMFDNNRLTDNIELENRYLKNDLTTYLSLEQYQIKSQTDRRWHKASNEVVLERLKSIRKLLIKGINPIEIFPLSSQEESFTPGSGYISPMKRKKHSIAECKREQYLTFLDILIQAQERNSWLILRDVYYRSTKIFGHARTVNGLINDISRTTRLNRLDLNIFTVATGSVYGNLSFVYDGNFINCMNSNGVSIPGKQHLVSSFNSSANFILIIEKATIFHHLIENNIIDELGPVIIITGNGQPDFSTRIFCHNLVCTLNIPIFALTDCNYYGFQIMTVYKYGSLSLQCDNQDLVVPDLLWIGLWPSDCRERNLVGKKMSEFDRSRTKKVLERSFMEQHPKWKEEMELLLELNMKIEIQSLFDYDCQSSPVILYIREKLMMHEMI